MIRKILPFILASFLFGLTACNNGLNSPNAQMASERSNDNLRHGSSEAGEEVMVPDSPEVMREDPVEVMREDTPEIMREDAPAAPAAPAEEEMTQVFDLSTCQPIFFSDASGNLTFYRCFDSNFPVFSTKGVCVDDHGLKMDQCPNDSTPVFRATMDSNVVGCEELGKQWCVNRESNAWVLCPSL